MPEGLDDEEKPDLYAAQRRALPRVWALFDTVVLAVTRAVVFGIGVVFCLFIFAEVTSRYLFSFSIFFVSAGAAFLLIWFFFLGAGLALREGAHMGLTVLTDALSPAYRKAAFILGTALSAVFLVMIFISSLMMLGPGLLMTEPSIGISMFWGFLAVPVSFGLLIYHLATLLVVELSQSSRREGRPA